MSKKRVIISTAILTLITASSFKAVDFCKRQGIKGKVYFVSGNQMPSPDIPTPEPKPIKTSLYIFELTNISQVTGKKGSPFYTSINTRLVKEVRSNSEGRFKVRLDAGEYSVFTKKGDLFYANTFDQFNNIASVKVVPGSFAELNVRIDYDAAY
ncbi:MAG: carboxypeptidase regulatory-like domain-containing protein [Terrimonas sp.]|nr:carboxypeptidase regulatory-like domain-containing protein [Terrimonas sp.]